MKFYARGLLDAWARHHFARHDGLSDPLLAGGTSLALEDYRRQKAELAKLDLAERRKELVPLEDFRDLLWRIIWLLRKAGEQLQRQCGHEAWSILDEALVACELEMRARFNGSE